MGDDGRDAVVVDVVRTTLGKRKGALANWHPADLLGFALTSLVGRTGVDPELVDDVIGGCVTQAGEQSTNVTRNAWVAAGLPQQVPATTVDRQCGSSQQAMHFAAAGVKAGQYDLVVACGVETMSRVPLASNARGGTGPFPPSFLDQIDGRLWAQFRVAQVLADRWGITREEMDAVRPREPSAGGGGVGRGPVRGRGRARPAEGRGRQADGRVARDRRGHPPERVHGVAGRAAAGPVLGAGHRPRHHRRQLVADDRRGRGHAHRRTVGGRAAGPARSGPGSPTPPWPPTTPPSCCRPRYRPPSGCSTGRA